MIEYLVAVELLPAGAPSVRQRVPGAEPWLGNELVVVDDRSRAWIGPAAFLTCLWATARYRSWAYRLATPGLAPLAERFFRLISKRRDRWSSWLRRDDPECSWCDELRAGGWPDEVT